MVGRGARPEPDEWVQAADRLALALEEVGFDVGRAFPLLGAGVGRTGVPVVELGAVSVGVAAELAGVLSQAAAQGLSVPGGQA